MVCKGRVGGSGYTPNIDPKNQPNVPKFQQAFGNNNGSFKRVGQNGTKLIFEYKDKDGKAPESKLKATYDTKTGATIYQYEYQEGWSIHTITAEDRESDGSIDEYNKNSVDYDNGDKSSEHVNINPKPFVWYDPRTWF